MPLFGLVVRDHRPIASPRSLCTLMVRMSDNYTRCHITMYLLRLMFWLRRNSLNLVQVLEKATIKSVVGQSCLHSSEAVVKQQTSTWNTISENKWNCKSFEYRCKSGLRSNRHVRETLTAYCIDSVHGISADPRDSNIRMRYIFQYLQHRPARYHSTFFNYVYNKCIE